MSIPGGLKDGKDLLMFYRQYGEIDPEESPPLLFCHGEVRNTEPGESSPLSAVHLSRHKWPGGLVN